MTTVTALKSSPAEMATLKSGTSQDSVLLKSSPSKESVLKPTSSKDNVLKTSASKENIFKEAGGPNHMKRKSTIMITNELRFFTDTWVMEEPIGQPGAFGVAYICHRRDSPDAKFVVKQINKARFYHIDKAERDLILFNMSNEIKLQKTLHHDNICLLYDVYEDRNYIHLVMDYLQGGELFDRICEADGFNEQQAASIAKQVLEAIAFMHNQNICHLDLKPDNILFEDKSEESSIKVIDFGMAQVVPRLKKLKQTVGTPYYTAPEVLGGAYDRAADIWSIGIIVFCMLFGYPPFYVDSNEMKMGESEEDAIYKLVKEGFNAEIKEGYGPWFPEDIPVSDNARDLISKMLRLNVKNRLTAAEALDHPWIRGQAHTTTLPRTVFSSLVNFNKTNRFKVLISRMFAKHLEPERYAETVEVFKKWDKDGNGEISLEEFREGMKQATKLSDEEIDSIFSHLDVDDNRTITIDELIVSSAFDALVAVDERMFDAFSLLDEDGDGELDIAEIKKTMADLKIKDLGRAESILAEIDFDANGKIDYEEFLRALHPTLNEPNTDDMSRLKSKGFGSLDQNQFSKYVFRSKKAKLIDGSLDPNILIHSYSKAMEGGLLLEDIDTFGADDLYDNPNGIIGGLPMTKIPEDREDTQTREDTDKEIDEPDHHDDDNESTNHTNNNNVNEPGTMTPGASVPSKIAVNRQPSNNFVDANEVMSLTYATSRSTHLKDLTKDSSKVSSINSQISSHASVVDDLLTDPPLKTPTNKTSNNSIQKQRAQSDSVSDINHKKKEEKKIKIKIIKLLD